MDEVLNSQGDASKQDYRELLVGPIKKRLVIPDRKEQLEKMKKLREGKVEQVSENQLKVEQE